MMELNDVPVIPRKNNSNASKRQQQQYMRILKHDPQDFES